MPSQKLKVVSRESKVGFTNECLLRLPNGYVVVGYRDGTLRLHDEQRNFSLGFLGGEVKTAVIYLAIIGSDEKLLSVHQRALQIWNMPDRTFNRVMIFSANILHFAMCSDGRHFALVCSDHPMVIDFWDIENTQAKAVESCSVDGSITGISMQAKGTLAYTILRGMQNTHQFKHVFQPLNEAMLSYFPDVIVKLVCGYIGDDTKIEISLECQGVETIYKYFSFLPFHLIPTNSIAVYSLGIIVLAEENQGRLRFFAEGTFEELGTIEETRDNRRQPTFMAQPLEILLILKNNQLVCRNNQDVFIINVDKRTIIDRFRLKDIYIVSVVELPEQCIAFAVSRSHNAALQIWDCVKKQWVYEGCSSINGLVASPDGQLYYSQYLSCNIVALIATKNRLEYKQEFIPIPEPSILLSYLPNQLVTRIADKQIKIWQISPFCLSANFIMDSALQDFVMAPDGNHFFTAHANNTVRLWSLKRGGVIDFQYINRPSGGNQYDFNRWRFSICPDGRLACVVSRSTGSTGIVDFPSIHRLRMILDADEKYLPDIVAEQMSVPSDIGKIIVDYLGKYSFWQQLQFKTKMTDAKESELMQNQSLKHNK